jgi:WD40 repeat protein
MWVGELDRDRVAEVIAGTDDRPTARRGSGYRVTSEAVLTAAHVVSGAGHVQVRFMADLSEEWSVPARVEALDPVADVAVLSILPRVPGEKITPALFGVLGFERAVPVRCTAVGFPRFKLREDSQTTLEGPLLRYRDSHQADGTIAPLSNWRDGSLEIRVPPPAPDPDPEHSPWEGMSGAAVWCKGRIIGVVSKHYSGDGLGRLAAARIERLYSTSDLQSLTSACELAGFPAQQDQLVDVSDPAYAGVMECPYRGLQPFTSDDARFFFGRQEVVTHLLEVLARQPFVAVVGASGSGKSSVLSAGLIPAASTVAGAGPGYHCVRITPTADPIGQLADAVATWSGVPAAWLHEDPLARITNILASQSARVPPLLLIADQMEELHTLCEDEQARRAFTGGLLALIGGDRSQNRVVIGVRTDFYAKCAEDPDLGSAMDNRQVNLRAMGKAELRSIIEEPAALTGLHIDPRLTEVLLADIGDEPGKLPLLSHALLATFERRRGAQLTVEDYIAVGRVQGALDKTADEAYESLDSGERDVAQAIFIRCTAGDGTIPDTRRPVRRADLDPETFPGVDAVLNRLAAARLVTLTTDQAGEGASQTEQQAVEVVHEALIRSWGRLKGWLEAYRRYRPVHQDLIAAAGKWDMSGRPIGRLYQGANLEEARKLLTSDSAVRLTLTEREFLAASQAAAKRRTRRIGLLAIGLVVALLLGTAAVLTAVNQGSQKDAQQQLAIARQLAGTSDRLLSTNLPVAQLLAVEAYHLDQDPQTLAALFHAVTYSPALVRYLQAGSPVSAIGGASGGKWVVAGTSDGKVMRWNVTGGPRAVIADLGGAITAVASNADGTVVAAATASKVATWTPSGGARQIVLPRTGSIHAVAVSPSGRYVAVTADGLTLYDREKNTARIARGVSGPYAVGMPSDTRLVVADGGGPWQVLSLPGLANVLGPTTVSTGVHQVVQALSANGQFVGYSNGGATIPVWDTAHMATLNTLQDLTGLSHGSDPQALGISPDGKRVAVADGGTIYISDTSRGTTDSTSQLSLPGNGSTTALQFLGNDDHLVSATGSLLALWDLNHLGRIGTGIEVKAPYVCEACAPPQTDISPNGRLAATVAGNPSTIYVHDLLPGGSQYSFAGGPQVTYQLLGWDSSSNKFFFISADGHTLDTAQVDDGIRIVERRRIPFSDYGVLAFSQAGNRLIEISSSGSVQIVPLAGAGRVVRIPSSSRPGYSLIGAVVDPTSSYLAEQFESDKAVDVDVKLIDLKTGHIRDLGSGNAPGITFSGDYLLVQRTDADMEVWNSSGTSMKYLIREDPSYLPTNSSAETAPAVVGAFLVQEQSDGTLAVTQLSTGTLLGALPAPSSSPLLKTGLSTDGADQLVSVREAPPISDEGTLIRWDLSPQSWIRDACVTAGRSLTPADWQQYGSGPMPGFLACANSS